jgi:hypothetical protein
METLIVEEESRPDDRPRRAQLRHAKPLAGFFSEAENNSEEEESKPRFQIDPSAPAIKRDPQKSPMRVLLRHAKNMKFLGAGKRWTKDPRQARDFRNGWWATVYAFTMNPRHLVIHYEFDDERYNLNIPVLGQAET